VNSTEKNWQTHKNQGSDPANPYTHPNSLKGPAVLLQKLKANLCYLQQEQDRPHRLTAGASPRCVAGHRAASDRTPIPLTPSGASPRQMLPTSLLHSGECHSLQGSASPQPGWDISSCNTLLPAHLFECL